MPELVRAQIGRRDLWRGVVGSLLTSPFLFSSSRAEAFGEEGAFHPRILLTGTGKWDAGARRTAPARWSYELARRTSAPTKTVPGTVRADSSALLAEPFVIWSGDGAISPLSQREIDNLRKFIFTGGTILVDDFRPEQGAFTKEARRELGRVLPDALVTKLPENHVIFHSFYLLSRAYGRIDGPKTLEAITRGGNAQVLFTAHDLLGALARDPTGSSAFEVTPGGDRQREMAIRLAVNIAMYVLCSTYKDDQVHAKDLMQRKAPER